MNRTAAALAPFLAASALAAVPPAVSLGQAEAQVLTAWDDQDGRGPLPHPRVDGKDEAGLRWLLAAAGPGVPANPFRPGTSAWREAEAVRALSAAKDPAKAIRDLPLTYGGSALALWKWARAKDLPPAVRTLWEDRLVGPAIPPVLRSNALRHALCHALAGKDQARFGQLRRDVGQEDPVLFLTFQKAFALLGGESPLFHLWSLPDLAFRECGLKELDARRVLILPWSGGARPPLPGGTAWIIPLLEDRVGGAADALDTPRRVKGEALAKGLGNLRNAWYAPGDEPFTSYGLIYFPVDIDLDPEGRITSIAMGDASPTRAAMLRRSRPPAKGR